MQPARQTAADLRQQLEQDLAHRVPSALSPRERLVCERISVGLGTMDDLLGGGIPLGAITELVGEEGSGRTSFATALLARTTGAGGVCAWVDVADVLDPLGVASSGVDLQRLLWVRCGAKQGSNPSKAPVQEPGSVHPAREAEVSGAGPRAQQGGCGSPHPRSEARGMSEAVSALLQAQPRSSALPLKRQDRSIGTPSAPNRSLPSRSSDREEQVDTDRLPPRRGEQLAKNSRSAERQMPPRPQAGAPAQASGLSHSQGTVATGPGRAKRGWAALDQALRATDLLLQSGGFSLLVLDLGSTSPEMSWRIPLATWFRFRAACERTRTSLLLLTQHPCARSSAELVLRLGTGRLEAQGTVLTGMIFNAELERQRFGKVASNVVPIRKPVQREQWEKPGQGGQWEGHAAWSIKA